MLQCETNEFIIILSKCLIITSVLRFSRKQPYFHSILLVNKSFGAVTTLQQLPMCFDK